MLSCPTKAPFSLPSSLRHHDFLSYLQSSGSPSNQSPRPGIFALNYLFHYSLPFHLLLCQLSSASATMETFNIQSSNHFAHCSQVNISKILIGYPASVEKKSPRMNSKSLTLAFKALDLKENLFIQFHPHYNPVGIL